VYRGSRVSSRAVFCPDRLPAPRSRIVEGPCSIDGFYDSQIDVKPWIVYANDVHPRRVRFTVLHELGHHLLVTNAAQLLDAIDVVGGSAQANIQAEEAVCHRFAGKLLVPDDLLVSGIGVGPVLPEHVKTIHEVGAASWEAIAVRVAEVMPVAGAVVLVRDGETVGFCAASSRLGPPWWSRGSPLDPSGPLSRAFRLRQMAVPERYRFGLGYARNLFCDTLPIHEGLAIGVLSERPSDGSLAIIEELEPAWKERIQFCEWCPGVERDRGWCDRCKGQFCPDCGRCGCKKPVLNPMCPSCGLFKAFRAGAAVCRDCQDESG